MATVEQLAAQIRFHLSELGARNAHHEFEHLCREYAKRRIASNILPATGPVSAGGDQGRDFETFRSYLKREFGDGNAFLALVSDQVIAFSCTTQSDRLVEKIRSDVARIMAGGQPVDSIYYMLSTPFPVARRHELEADVLAAHSVGLTIIDGLALAEGLAEPDLFPIAERYLQLPAELAPTSTETSDSEPPDWYTEGRSRWNAITAGPGSLGQLLDLKNHLRFATFNVAARPDLGFWIEKMLPTTEAETVHLRQRARYEISVAQIRGARDLRPADGTVRAYFHEAVGETDPTRMSDAAVLLWYVIGAVGHDATAIRASEVYAWNDSLRQQVRLLLEKGPYPHAKASLLQVLGHLAAMPVIPGPHADRTELPDVADMFDEDGNFQTPAIVPRSVGLVDSAEVMSSWLALSAQLTEAPLFPVGDFSQMLSLLTPVLVDLPKWRELTQGIDEALARSRGKAAAAESARDRAFALMRSNRILDALEEMQQAKVEWWTAETIRGALLASLLISELYRRLRMPAAAKQYAVVAAGAAMATGDDELVDIVGRGLRAAASSDHLAGGWCDATLLYGTSLTADSFLLEEGLDVYDEGVAAGMAHTAWVLLAARDLTPRMYDRLVNALPAGTEEFLREHLDLDAIATRTADEWQLLCDEQLCGRAFSDLGLTRVLRFQALGLDWTVEAPNNHRMLLVSSRFVAAAQILLVELAREDLILAKNKVTIQIEAGPSDLSPNRRIEAVSDNVGRKWTVRPTVPGVLDAEAIDVEVLTMLAMILLDASFAPKSHFDAALERAFQRGLRHKLSFGRPLEEVLEGFVSDKRFADLRRMDVRQPLSAVDGPSAAHPELAWQSGPGPTMSADDLAEAVQARYEKIPSRIPRTMARLQSDARFKPVVAELRRRGWLDWHIASAILNITMNAAFQKLSKSGLRIRSPRDLEPAQADPESIVSDDELGLSAFSVEELEQARQFALPAVAQNYGLEGRQEALDFQSLEELLAERYGYWTVDVPHKPLF